MLDFLLSSLDEKCCKETIILFEMNNNGEKTEIEIDDKTISEINTLFESADDKLIEKLLYFAVVTIQNNKKIVYLHKRNFEISNSRHADERNTNWSYAMLSRDTKITS